MVGRTRVVSNASPLIAFARLGRLDLLRDLFDAVLVPSAVWSEVTAKEVADSAALAKAREDSWLVVRDPEDVPELSPLLDAGETAAIGLARGLDSCLLLIDEEAGRKVARRVGCEVIGTLGVLALAKRKGLVDAVAPLVADLQSASFRIAPNLIEALLRSIGESRPLDEQERLRADS